MKKFFLSIIFSTIMLLVLNGCNNGSDPVSTTNSDNLQIDGQLQKEAYITPGDSLVTETSPSYSIDYKNLKLNRDDLDHLKYLYPGALNIPNADREFIISSGDSFTVAINNCKAGCIFDADLGTIKISSPFDWTNSGVVLERTERQILPDSSINYKFIFRTTCPNKGYISFIEKDGLGTSSDSRGLLIGYDANAIQDLAIEITDIQWIYKTAKGEFSTVGVNIKGETNAYRLRATNSGDGILMAFDIPINSDGSFEASYNIAFSYVEGTILTTNTTLVLYGSPGLPKTIVLKNPKAN